MKKIVTVLSLIVLQKIGVGQQLQTPSYGTIERVSIPSQYTAQRPLDVWLPENYNTETAYNVLYMHDGQMLFDSANTWNHKEWSVDETIQRLINNKSIAPTIVVGIHHIDSLRYAEYLPNIVQDLPKKMQEQLQKKINNKYNSDNYLKFITKELKPYIDAHYSTNKTAEHTFIAGSSMGGLISIYAISEYPSVFGGAICMSTHWPGGDPNDVDGSRILFGAFKKYISNHQKKLADKQLYFDHGTTTLDSFYAVYQKSIDRMFKQSKHPRYVSRVYKGDAHQENAWANRFDIAVLSLQKK
jgi:enterochelin esterase-like enzyme